MDSWIEENVLQTIEVDASSEKKSWIFLPLEGCCWLRLNRLIPTAPVAGGVIDNN